MDEDNMIEIGLFNEELNNILETNMPITMIYQSKGLPTYMVKTKHFKCLKYINYISDIVNNPDYIDVNANESGETIELIKRFKDNV